MKFVLANWGSRGEIEPCAAIGRELQRRGHEVCLVVPPDLVGFIEAAGLTAVAYGLDYQLVHGGYRDFWTYFFRNFWQFRKLNKMWAEVQAPLIECRKQVIATLKSVAKDADVLVTGMNYEEVAANVAEACDVPFIALHYFPMRTNGQLLSFLPPQLGRLVMRVFWWMSWRGPKKVEDEERRELGLPTATTSWAQRIVDRGSLEVQAYDERCFPGLAAEWADWNARQPAQRPFVGTLTMELATVADAEVVDWIAAGTPPICFSFGSIPVESPSATIAMISTACTQLGERALVCAGATDFSGLPLSEHVKIVGTMNYATVFPACRAVAHHGGAGTTAASLRAGIPTLVLWSGIDQRVWGVQVDRLKVGASRRFATVTEKTLVEDLRQILTPEYAVRAKELAGRMKTSTESVAAAADVVETFASLRQVG
ncbi:putative enzyme [uncultured Mycobacterium sp.]|uniref:Putative enzyme n=1 Tax=uncultured Mycobacterium sp. TaxID=171292 RepID=A0A1Y5PAG6_9MYCO|nr:putative enzyme [uncultured Mycobacterium sp.]SBS75695.1 putative enzyme [uncultured Mycobacterium sp.]